MPSLQPVAELIETLAGITGRSDLLAALHRHAHEIAGAPASALLRVRAPDGTMTPVSTHGVAGESSGDWLTGPAERRAVEAALASGEPQVIGDLGATPGLAARLGTPAAILAPLRRGDERVGVLVLGVPASAAAAGRGPARLLAAAFLLAIACAERIAQTRTIRQALENTLDAIGDLVGVCDRSLRLVHVNEAFASRVGLAVPRIVDHPIAEFVGRRLLERIADRARASGEVAGRASAEQIPDERLGGIFSVTLCARRTRDGTPDGVVMVARDVTRDAETDREHAALRERLTQSEKLAALGQFIAGIAHELNNPLQGVLGHVELLRQAPHLPKPLQRDLRTVYREADRAARIVRNLLVFAGSRRLTRRRVSVNAVIGRVLALRAAATRAAGIEVVRVLDNRLPAISADTFLLQQAFLNIVLNAEHAVAHAPRRRLEVRTRRAPGGVIVIVHDSGPGIAPDVLPRIFEPFYTTKEVGQGTGLGLAIAYGILQEHGGTIAAHNHADGGAVVTVRLPGAGKVVK